MKKIFIVLVLQLLLYSNSFCQLIDKLDERNGFKTLKLGDDISLFKDKIQFYDKNSEITKYQYIGLEPELKKLFDYSLSGLILSFHNSTNKLVVIELINEYQFNEYSYDHYKKASEDFEKINSNFSSLFGLPSPGKTEETSEKTVISAIWLSKKVLLKTSLIYYGLKKNSEISTIIADIKSIMQKTDAGF